MPQNRELERKPTLEKHFIPANLRMPKLRGWVLEEATIAKLQQHYEQEGFSCTDYTRHCIDYIQGVNMYLEAVIEINRNALSIAKQLDEERLANKARGPRHGTPILIKDNIAVDGDSIQTTAGSWDCSGALS